MRSRHNIVQGLIKLPERLWDQVAEQYHLGRLETNTSDTGIFSPAQKFGDLWKLCATCVSSLAVVG